MSTETLYDMFWDHTLDYHKNVLTLCSKKRRALFDHFGDNRHLLRGKTFSRYQLYVLGRMSLIQCTAVGCGHWRRNYRHMVVDERNEKYYECSHCVVRKEQKEKHREMTKKITLVHCDKKQLCPMCMANVKKNTSASCLPCGHQFHQDCIMTWLNGYKKNCPMCRADI